MSKIKKTSAMLLVLAFTLTPISFSALIEYSQADDSEIIASDQEWLTDRMITRSITINAGATLFIRNGVTLTFDGASNINVQGKIVIGGTSENPVKLRRAADARGYYSITVQTGGKVIMKNVDVSGAGASIRMIQNNSILNTANAYFQGGIHLNGGSLDAQGCNFHDNVVAIYASAASAGKVIVNRSKFSNSSQLDVAFNNFDGTKTVNFKYNWWGDADGPPKTCYEGSGCYYDKMDGDVDASDWLTEEDFHDPVIIIPGILGSWQWTNNGEWKLDPIFKMYDNLVETFEENGYTENEDLFVFPYQWRDSNVNNANLLQAKIKAIREDKNWPKVDLVAHSMGGLLAREYIESADYQNDIDQLVTVGTPHNGAPEDYLTWDGGYVNFSKISVLNEFAKLIFKQEAQENGYVDIFDYVHNLPMKSVRELLPTYDYLKSADSGEMRQYDSHYPKNTFLENLNLPENLDKLSSVEFINIVGKLDDSKTISEIKVGKPSIDENSLWAHGKPENFDALSGDHGLSYGDGDGTVPFESTQLTLPLEVGERAVEDRKIELALAHTELPSKGADEIFEAVTGQLPSKEMPASFIDNIFVVFIFSPIDVQVISPSGKIVGKDFEHNTTKNQIDGAYYTGYNTDNEIVSIPNPEDGEYQIITQGTGAGDYKIEATKIFEDSSGDAKESTATFIGTASVGSTETLKAKISGDKVTNPDEKVTETEAETSVLGEETSDSDDDSNDSDDSNSDHKKNNNKKTNLGTNLVASLGFSNKDNVENNLLLASKENPFSAGQIENKSQQQIAGEESSSDKKPEPKSNTRRMLGILSLIILIFAIYFSKKPLNLPIN
ncbi:MAG: alpha/beta fold hydrolase [Candidatus Moraniibacteriota bacterium]